MKFWIGFLVICFVGCSAPEKHSVIPAGAKVLVLGDSLSYGTGAAQDEDYPTLLAKSTGWNMINAGIPGNTSAEGLARLPALLEEHQPALLVLELGGNDFLQHAPNAQTVANLKQIIHLAQTKKLPVILVAIPELSVFSAAVGNLSDHPMYEALAEETKTPLIAEVFSGVLSQEALRADQVHPNAAGYREVSVQMYEKLQTLGFVK